MQKKYFAGKPKRLGNSAGQSLGNHRAVPAHPTSTKVVEIQIEFPGTASSALGARGEGASCSSGCSFASLVVLFIWYTQLDETYRLEHLKKANGDPPLKDPPKSTRVIILLRDYA